jgi:hypothetical protein
MASVRDDVDMWSYNAVMDNMKHMVTGKEISTQEYERRKREGTLAGDKAPLGEDEKSNPERSPTLPMPSLPPPVYLPQVRVVPVDRVCEAIEQVLTLYRQSPDVERYARHVADKVLAMGTEVRPIVSAEVRDPKELIRR